MASQNYLSYLRQQLIVRIAGRGLPFSASTYRVLGTEKGNADAGHPNLAPIEEDRRVDLLLLMDVRLNRGTPLLGYSAQDLFEMVEPGGVMLMDFEPASRKRMHDFSANLETAGFHVEYVLYYGFFTILWNLPLRILGFRFHPRSKVLGIWNSFLMPFVRMERKLHPYLRFITGERMMVAARHIPFSQEPVKDLSIVIPSYNEEKRLPPYLETIQTYMKSRKLDYEILVIDDGSRDQTTGVAKKAGKRVRAIRLYKNFGKGGAVKEGIRLSRGQRILIADADGATPIEELEKLEARMELGRDIVIGSRYLSGSEVVIRQSPLRRLLSRGGNLMIRVLTGLPFRDTQCGFKLFQQLPARFLFRDLENLRFGFDFEILMNAKNQNFVMEEVPVRWYDREGSKVRSIDSIRVLWELLDLKFGKFIRFGTVGVLNTMVDLVIHNALILGFGVGTGLTQTFYNGISFIVANMISYVLNSGYAFAAHGAYIRFFLVSFVTLYISSVSYYSLASYFNPQQDILIYNLLKISSITVSLFTNYFGYRLLVFRDKQS